jgi:hypothetical protein
MNDEAVVAKDLIALVADKNMEAAVRALLTRHHSIDISELNFDCFVHPDRDPGCLKKAASFLAIQLNRYKYALVVFDHDGCGREGDSRELLENDVELALAKTGWKNRCAAIVIDPELENCVWSDSPIVEATLGWKSRQPTLRSWVSSTYGLQERSEKPVEPKQAVEEALRIVRKPRSSSIYQEIAARVSLNRCTDPAFQKLKAVLKSWFGAQP